MNQLESASCGFGYTTFFLIFDCGGVWFFCCVVVMKKKLTAGGVGRRR
jgi:hypothetical protein